MLKITLLKSNTLRDIVSLEKGIAEVKNDLASINFPVEITEKDTSTVFTSIGFKNATIGQGYCVVPEQILAEVTGNEDVAFLLFSNKNIVPTPLNPVQTGIKKGNATPCQMCEEWYNDFDFVMEDFFLHELCHSVFYLTRNANNDLTHSQFSSWNGKFDQSSNKAYYLYLLSSLLPAWNTYKNMNTIPTVTITRGTDDGVETLGVLTAPNFSCKTLERSLNPKIAGSPTCIPKGTYTASWAFQGDLNEYHYELQNIPGFTGVFIHPGNFFKNTLGCILLGDSNGDINADKEQDVLHSRTTLAKFEQLMGQKPFTIIIK